MSEFGIVSVGIGDGEFVFTEDGNVSFRLNGVHLTSFDADRFVRALSTFNTAVAHEIDAIDRDMAERDLAQAYALFISQQAQSVVVL